MTYKEAQDFIAYTERLGSRPGLDAILELLRRLGYPQDKRPVVHIAGTNGKGSIFAFLDAILRDGGYRVGRYISPTLFTYLERFQINGVSMDEETFARLAGQVREVCRAMADEGLEQPTAFEVETAIAFLYFSEENVDIILLETGMGGREDATNVVANPIATVFSSISRDHMVFLGDSISSIAREKAGIMRECVPVVIAPMDKTARGVLLERAKALHANVVDVSAQSEQEQSADWCCAGNGSEFVYEGQRYRISLPGVFQIDNAKTAIAVYRVIQQQFPLSGEQLSKGLAKAHWAGRFEIMRTAPYTLIRDGAHNPDAARRLKESLLSCFPDCRYHFILGMYQDKEHDVVLRELLPVAASLTAVTPPNPKRALSADKLFQEAETIAAELGQTCQPVSLLLGDSFEGAQTQLQQQFQMNDRDVVIVCGSLSLAQIMVN